MHVFHKLSGNKKSAQETPNKPSEKQREANIVSKYSRGSVYLQFGRYYTDSDKEARRQRIAEMEL